MGNCIGHEIKEGGEVSDEEVVVVGVADESLGFTTNGVNMPLSSLYSKRGTKDRNQDSAILCQGFGVEDGIFCGVFDGHGQNGHMVSRTVRDSLPSLLLSQWNAIDRTVGKDYGHNKEGLDGNLDSCKVFDEWKEACFKGFKVMEKELKLHGNLDCSCSGTTAVTIIKQGKDIMIANLGDSRAVLGTKSDKGSLMAIQLTTDLKPSVLQEAERIKKCNGRIFALKDEPDVQRVWLPMDEYPGLAMSRAFGDFVLKNHGVIAVPQISHHHITDDDEFIVLATDGVWDVLSNNHVMSIVWSAESEEAASRMVVDAAIRGWRHKYPCSKVDDCTVACLFLQDRKQQL